MKILNNPVQTTITLLLAILLTTTSYAQYTFTNYYANRNYVNDLAIDGDIIWIGTSHGILKRNTDGILLNSTYNEKNVIGIAIDNSGNKWFGCNENYDYQKGKLIKFDDFNWTTYNHIDPAYNRCMITAFAIDNTGNIWLGTQVCMGCVQKFDGSSFTAYYVSDGLVNSSVNAIAIDSIGKWFGTNGGISKFDGTNWTTYDTSNSGLADNYVKAIAIDNEGNKWFGTNAGGVSKFDGTNWTTYDTTNSNLISNYINAIVIDNEGNKWFGTNGGVSKFDGTNWTTYTTADGLANNDVRAIAIDNTGNKWFGTWGGGVSKFDDSNWFTYSTTDGLADNNVRAIAIDNESNKWFGTWEEVSKFDGTNWTTYNIYYIWAIAIDSAGNKWFGSYGGGVSKFDDSNWFTYYSTTDGLADNDVLAIAIDSAGNKWFGTVFGGVSKFDGTNWTTYTTADGLADNGFTTSDVCAIAIDNEGNKWFGILGGGVSKFDDTNWTTYTTADGLANNGVNAIAIDNEGNKWFGTSGGVSKFDGTNWTTYTTSDGLINNGVTAITIDNEGNKWFGTNGGVSKFDGTNWTSYTTSDGLAKNDVYAIAIDNEGNKWFGTGGGVSQMFCEAPVVDFNITGNLCEGNVIQFNNNSTKTDVFTKYEWDINNDGSVEYTTENIEYSFNAGDYTVKLIASNENCTDSCTKNIIINPLPSAAGTISGNITVCQGETNLNYSVPTIENADTYIWTLPTGTTGSSTTNSITIDYGLNAVSGNITVKGHNDCGDGTEASLAITVNPLPNAASTISGNTTVCKGEQNVTYSVPTIENADSYIWTLPTGATGSSTTNSITIDYGLNAVSGNITVKGHNDCGDGTEASLAITVNPLPNAASTISGNTTVCKGDQNVTYSVPTIENADTYIWTLPTGATGSSTTIVLQ